MRKQECEAKGEVWDGKDCKEKSVVPITPSGGNWSDYQGSINWEDAMAKCASIGMRLPTIDELRKAYADKITEPWR